MSVTSCLLQHFSAKSPIAAYRQDMAADVQELVADGMDTEAAWLQVADAKLADLKAERTRIEQSVADAYGKTAAGKKAAPAEPVAEAMHKDPGGPAEVVTPAVVADAIKTGTQATDRKPSEMKAELLAKIDEAVKEAIDYTDFEAVVKTMGLKDATAVFTDAKGTLGDKVPAGNYTRPNRTFRVEGDGVFTIQNTVRQLLTFRAKVESSPGFSDRKIKPGLKERATDALDRRSQDQAIANMIDEGDFVAAQDYAAAVGADLADVKLTKVLRERLDKWQRDTKMAADVAEFEARKPQDAAAPEPAAMVAEPAPAPAPAEPPAAAGIASQTFDQWVRAKYDGNEYKARYLEEFEGDERRAILGAAIGTISNDRKTPDLLKEARAKYHGELLALPRETRIGLDVWDALGPLQYDAQRHFYDLDARITRRTQDETSARVKAETAKKAPYEAAYAEVDAEIRRLDKIDGPETQKQKDLSARRDRLREALYQIGQGKEPDGRLLKSAPAPAAPMKYREADTEAKRLTAETGKPYQAVNRERVDEDGYTVSEWFVEPTKAAPAGKPAPGRYAQPVKERGASRDGQMEMANRASRIASLSALNDMVRQREPESAYTDDEIQGAANIDAMQDWLSERGRAKLEAAALEGQRRDPAKANTLIAPYNSGDIVAIGGKDWMVKSDTPGWYLTSDGTWRGEHPTIKGIKGMADLIRAVDQAAQEAAPAAAESKPRDKIGDFGEKLVGARKDYAATLKDAESVDIRAEPLSKSWPEPDYEKMLAGGADPFVVGWVRASRDEVPTKPQTPWKLRGWVDSVTLLRGTAMKLLDGTITKQTLEANLAKPEFANLRRKVGARADLYQAVGHERSLKSIALESGSYGMRNGVAYNPAKTFWTVSQNTKATTFGNWPRELAVSETREGAIQAFKDKIGSIDLGAKAKGATQFVIYRKRGQEGAFIGKKIGREHIDLKKFADVAEARKFLAGNTAELEVALEKYKETPYERKTENAPRVGDDHRNGAAVTPEAFADAFGFRGVQFGNYVEQGRRQSDLNQAFDALMDMAAVLGIPPRAISLNGRLGLAFGARGKGGKNAPAAHYEPGNVVINLTKGGGPGSLAHEWWHSLDNYFGKESGSGGYGTGNALGDKVREEMRAAFKIVQRETQVATLRQRAEELDKRRSKPYWNTPIELSARSFESYVIAKLNDQGAANDYLANVVSPDFWDAQEAMRLDALESEKPGSTFPYPTAAELPRVRAAFDTFFQQVQTRTDDAGNVAMFSRAAANPQRAASTFSEARTAAAAFQGQPLTNEASGLVAVVSRNSLDKMLSASAVSKSETPSTHALAVANIDRLFQRAILGWSKPDRAGDSNIVAIHRFFSVLNTSDGPRMVKLTVKETAQSDRANPLYSVEAVELNEKSPAAEWVGEIASADGVDPRTIRSAEDVRILAQSVQDFNSEDQDGAFSRSTGRGIPMKDANAVAQAVREALPTAPQIIVHESVNQAPQALRDAIREAGAENDVEAAYHDGAIHVFPQHMASVERMAFVVGHHEIRHHGLRSMLGPRLGSVLLSMHQSNPALRAAAQAKIDEGLTKSRVEAIEEALADMPVEELAKLSGWDKIVTAVRQWLRDLAAKLRRTMPNLADAIDPMNWTDRDVAAMVRRAENISRGGGGGFRTSGTVFGRVKTLPAATDTKRYQNLKWEQASDDMQTAELGNGWVAAIVQNEDGTAELTTLLPNGADFGNPITYDHVGMARLAAPGVLARQVIEDGTQPGDSVAHIFKGAPDDGAMFSRASTAGAQPAAAKSATRTAQDLIDAKGGVFNFDRLGATQQDRIRTVMDGSRPYWLGTLTRDQLADVYGKEIPPVKEYDDLTRTMENERSKMAQDADDLYGEWSKIDAAANDRLARVMLDATVHQVDPDGPFKPSGTNDDERRRVHGMISTQFKLLPKDAQAMYGKVKAFHLNTLTKLRDALEARIERQVEGGQAKAAALTNIRQMFDKYLGNGPYFPLSRFGDFLVVAKREDGERVVASYETAGEQQGAARKLESDGFTVKMKTAKTYSRETDGAAGKFIGDILTAVDKLDMDDATVGGKTADLKAKLMDDINQMFIKALPDLSYRKHFMHRKGTAGFSSDVMRGFASSAFHSASHIARLNHGDKMTFALQDAFSAIESAPAGDFNLHSQVLNELTKRHDAALNPNTHPLAAMLNQVGFIMYLGLSPAAGIINMLQTVMVTMPHLGARYGFGKANGSLATAYKDILAAPANAKNGWNAAQSQKLTPAERAVMTQLQDEGVIDLTQAHDLASATGLDTGNVARSKAAFAMARAMKIVGWTFHIPEVMNRQVTALSAYRLEMEKSGNADAAKDAAREAIKRTHFDYSASNRARFMSGNVARVVTQFKQYSQNMTYLLGRAAHQALKGESPEVRSIARRQLVATLGVTFGMAGALGLPGLGGVMGLLGALAGALDDDDKPWDWKVEFRNALADTVGKEAGEVIAHGIPRALMPWDISGRVGLGDLWWRGSDREGQNPREAFATDMQNILGPTAGTLLGLYTASDHMARGNWSKAIESVVPKALRDPLKAIREGQEGMTNYNGEPLMDMDAPEVAGRLLGFAPARGSEMFEARNAVKNAETALNEKRQRLLSTMVKARLDLDSAAIVEIQGDINEFNRRNPTFRITSDSILKSAQAKRRNMAETEGGIRLPKGKDDLRAIGRFAEVE